MAFGGTPAGNRLIAAAQALGAPKAAPKAAARKVNVPQHPQKGRPAARPPSTRVPRCSPSRRSKPFHRNEPRAAAASGDQQVHEPPKPNFSPTNKSSGNRRTSKTVANRFGGYGEATEQSFWATSKANAASAKTFENQAATPLKTQAKSYDRPRGCDEQRRLPRPAASSSAGSRGCQRLGYRSRSDGHSGCSGPERGQHARHHPRSGSG